MKKFSLVLLVLLAILLIQHRAGGTTYIVFRYDDFAGDAPGIREADVLRRQIWEAERRVDQLFQKYGFPYVIAIIPKRDGTSLAEDLEKVSFVKDAVRTGRVEIAQHGFAHINHAKENHRVGEFRERDFESQLQDIKSGKEILLRALDLTDLSTFVPPWNSWDSHTAEAVKVAGFRILSADLEHYYNSIEGLVAIPFTSQLWELESVLEQGNLSQDGIVIVLYHPQQIVKSPGSGDRFFGIERFDKLLQRLAALPNSRVVTLQQLAQECDSLTTKRYRTANALWRQRSFWAKLLPKHLWPGESNRTIYLPTNTYARQLMLWGMLTAALTAGLLLAGVVTRYLIKIVLSLTWRRCIDVAASVVFVISITSEIYLVYRGYHPTGIRIIPAIFTASFLIAFIVRQLLLWQLYCIHFVFGRSLILMQFRLFSELVSAANVLRILGATVGPKTSIASDICIWRANYRGCSNLSIGANVYIGPRCLFDLTSKITIEDDVGISAQVSFVTHADVGSNKPLMHIFPRREGPITVQKGAWLGVNTTVLHGVTIGRCAMIGAMSLVNKDVPPNSLSVGIPCKVIKWLDKPAETHQEQADRT
ncbi:MAG: DUF2334 domain-containing protein [Planctomycetota bacterium]|nr:DUF2334 domain-containing protein [Planctomycetota bacterium]